MRYTIVMLMQKHTSCPEYDVNCLLKTVGNARKRWTTMEQSGKLWNTLQNYAKRWNTLENFENFENSENDKGMTVGG